MNKKQRQQAILKVISENEVSNHRTLRELLAAEGIEVGQATLSRDMRELELKKVRTENDIMCYTIDGLVSEISQDVEYNVIFAQSVISMQNAQNIVVLKCQSGLADAACKVVDEQNLDIVIGSIAGDDTVFLLTKDEGHAINLMKILKRLIKRN